MEGNVGETPGEIERMTDDHAQGELHRAISELIALQTQVMEWSELNHLLHKAWAAFSLFHVLLSPSGKQGLEASEHQALLQSWQLCQARLDALADFAREIKHIGSPLQREGRRLVGERWAVEIVALQLLFEDALKERELDLAGLLELAQEFDSACHLHMAVTNRRLRTAAEKLQRLTAHLGGEMV